MKVGINLLLWTDTPAAEHAPLFEELAGYGYDGVELPMYDLAASPWDELAQRLDDLGLGRTAVTIVFPDANPIDDDPAVRRRGIDHLKGCLDTCARLGAETLAGPFGSPVGLLVGRGRSAAEWDRAVEAFGEVAAHALEVGVKFSIEPLNRFETYFLNSVEDAAALAADVGIDGCGVLFDAFHAHIEEKSSPAAIRAAGEVINHVHISENDRSTPGTGQIDWPGIFAALHAVGYDGWLTVEAFGQALPKLAAATCIWRRLYVDEAQLARDAARFSREAWAAAE